MVHVILCTIPRAATVLNPISVTAPHRVEHFSFSFAIETCNPHVSFWGTTSRRKWHLAGEHVESVRRFRRRPSKAPETERRCFRFICSPTRTYVYAYIYLLLLTVIVRVHYDNRGVEREAVIAVVSCVHCRRGSRSVDRKRSSDNVQGDPNNRTRSRKLTLPSIVRYAKSAF